MMRGIYPSHRIGIRPYNPSISQEYILILDQINTQKQNQPTIHSDFTPAPQMSSKISLTYQAVKSRLILRQPSFTLTNFFDIV